MIAAVLLVPGICSAASFDCSRATTPVEKLICADDGLSQLDESLSKTYKEVLLSAPDPAGLKQEQVKWLREVRNRCTERACLEKEYRNRLATLEELLTGMKAGEKSVAPAETLVAPLRIIKEISDYRPAEYRMPFFDGRLFFSQYDKSGNNYDILALDTEDLSSEYILRGRWRAQLIAQNDKYLVVSEGGSANSLVVIDRASGKQVGQIGLNDSISWARIQGHRLIAIQRHVSHGGHSFESHALVLDLPSLKIIKSLKIAGVYDVQSWQGKILAVGYNLTAYDDDFNEIFKISLPKPKARGVYGCGERGPFRVYGDKAAIVANCGEILIYDLPTRGLERTISSHAHSYAMAIIDGLIFTSPKTPGGE
ncbi:MAG TPA: lysozyme inhibitor LprI family protein, partial [Desulfomonilaceae bacterium]|nr:lysozyme inhibitor LprI family protein [Desulfomonilaceae bacterium]